LLPSPLEQALVNPAVSSATEAVASAARDTRDERRDTARARTVRALFEDALFKAIDTPGS
jgi:hypothetical protein